MPAGLASSRTTPASPAIPSCITLYAYNALTANGLDIDKKSVPGTSFPNRGMNGCLHAFVLPAMHGCIWAVWGRVRTYARDWRPSNLYFRGCLYPVKVTDKGLSPRVISKLAPFTFGRDKFPRGLSCSHAHWLRAAV